MNLERRISVLEKLVNSRSDRIVPKIPSDFISFNNMIGLPLHPKTKKPTLIFDYQNELDRIINKYHKVLLNKSRKIGATEIADYFETHFSAGLGIFEKDEYCKKRMQTWNYFNQFCNENKIKIGKAP